MKTISDEEYTEFQNIRAKVNIGLSRESYLRNEISRLKEENERLVSNLKLKQDELDCCEKALGEKVKEGVYLVWQRDGLKLENSELESDLVKAKDLLKSLIASQYLSNTTHYDLLNKADEFLNSSSTLDLEQTEEPPFKKGDQIIIKTGFPCDEGIFQRWEDDKCVWIDEHGSTYKTPKGTYKIVFKVGEVEQPTDSQGVECYHRYSKAMNQTIPRACVLCGHLEEM